MRVIPFIGLLAAILVSATAAAEESGWRDENGKPIPDSDWQKSSHGFAAMLLNTSDPDWWEKWNQPETPKYTQAETVRKGGHLVTLIFMVNAAPGADGAVNVLCDMSVVRPDGSQALGVSDQPCLWGKQAGDPHALRLAPMAQTFVAEEGDPRGTWKVDITVRDTVRNITLDLHTSFQYLGDVPEK